MNVTRDVIYDLLPAYFAGEVSADSKTLIDEFFASDPEFGRMAERFRMLQSDLPRGGPMASEADRERETFNLAMSRVRKQRTALMWLVAAVVAFVVAGLTPFTVGLRHPGTIIGLAFSVAAAATWFSSVSLGSRVRH